MKLIVGLGNPGNEYERTRHNVGFVVVETIISNFQFPIFKFDKSSNAMLSKGAIEGKRTLITTPLTFMNNSGVAVRALLNFYKLTPADLIVIHDDKDIPLGETRVQRNRGAAGHNGVLSIIEHLGTKDFTRIRVGIGLNPLLSKEGLGGGLPMIVDTAAFVLGKFSQEEQKVLKKVIENVVEEVKKLI